MKCRHLPRQAFHGSKLMRNRTAQFGGRDRRIQRALLQKGNVRELAGLQGDWDVRCAETYFVREQASEIISAHGMWASNVEHAIPSGLGKFHHRAGDIIDIAGSEYLIDSATYRTSRVNIFDPLAEHTVGIKVAANDLGRPAD
jgi:hypothetical protein